MALQTIHTAQIQCSFGSLPVPLALSPEKRVLVSGRPAAVITDARPLLNILPFGLCSCPANPTVAAASGLAAGGVVPMPCIPAVLGAWISGKPSVLIGGVPALDSNSRLLCRYGGVISIQIPGQFSVLE